MTLAPPGPGPIALPLNTPPFYFLVAVLGTFILMLLVLRAYYPNRKRGFEGYLEAAGVSLAFLIFAVAFVVVIAMHDPKGNTTSFAFYETILTGYWLAFAIPVVTVGSSVQARSRGAIRWVIPSILVAIAMFFAIFAYYYGGH